jgi:hypothetical protein
MDNLTIITNQFDELKGQMVICSGEVLRFIGIADDDEDYYYVLYDGRTITLHSCVGRITMLKGYIIDRDYNEMIRLAKINHFDQPTLWGNEVSETTIKYSEDHKAEITKWNQKTRFILGPCWDLN